MAIPGDIPFAAVLRAANALVSERIIRDYAIIVKRHNLKLEGYDT
jgi:hypothetical protein